MTPAGERSDGPGLQVVGLGVIGLQVHLSERTCWSGVLLVATPRPGGAFAVLNSPAGQGSAVAEAVQRAQEPLAVGPRGGRAAEGPASDLAVELLEPRGAVPEPELVGHVGRHVAARVAAQVRIAATGRRGVPADHRGEAARA